MVHLEWGSPLWKFTGTVLFIVLFPVCVGLYVLDRIHAHLTVKAKL
jgi:hypothetical protein